MFWSKKKKEPKWIVDITIIVNLYNIKNFLSKDYQTNPEPIPKSDWGHEVTQTHRIFVMPPTNNQPEYYFHRSICKPSHDIRGAQVLSETGTEEVKQYCKEEKIYGDLEWDMWHNFLMVTVDRKVIAFLPINEASHIQLTGRTSSTAINLNSTGEVVKFPANFDRTELYSMHQTIDKDFVMYSNEFATVVFESPKKLVNYDYELNN
jgi:hypothetical protein